MSDLLNNRYRIAKKLGEGSMGRVYLATDESSGVRVAVKAMPMKRRNDPAFERFAFEFDLLRKIDIPGVAKALDFFFEESVERAYLVQEYVEGVDFISATKNASPVDVLHLALKIARSLAFLNSRDIVHGDIKPGNIIVSADGPVLIDFGLAGAGASSDEGIAGTISYMAPEVLGGAPPNPRSDLYSLGAVIFEAITGRRPHEAAATDALIRKIVAEAAPPIRKLSASIDPQAAAIIDKLLNRDPVNRHQTADGLARDIARVLNEPLEIEYSFPKLFTLVGRENETRELLAWMRESREKGSGSLLLAGAKGVGKSRLLAELRDSARASGVKTIFVSASDGAGASEKIVRELESAVGVEKSGRPASQTRYAAWVGLADAIERTMAVDPALLAIDGLESSSGSATDLIRFLVGEFNERHGLFVIAAGDVAESEWNFSRTTAVGRLDASNVRSIIAEAWGESPTEHDVAALMNLSGGNPLILIETLKTTQRGKIPSGGAPENVDAIFKIKLAALSSEARKLLDVAAVANEPMEASQLSLLTGLDAAAAYGELRRLESGGYVGSSRDGYFIPGRALASVVCDALPNGERRMLHSRIAGMLADDPSHPPAAAARHYIESGDAGRGADWTIKAWPRMISVGAAAEAAALCADELRILSESDPRRDTILEDLGKAASLAGMYDDALDAWNRRIESASNDVGLKKASFMIEAARCLRRKGEYAKAEDMISRAEAEMGGSSGGDNHGVAFDALELRTMLSIARGNYKAAADLASRGIEFAEGDAEKSAFVTLDGIAKTHMGDYDNATADFALALGELRSGMDGAREIMALSGLGVALQHKGDMAGAIENYHRAFDVAGKIGDMKARMTNSMNKATVYHQTGDFAKAVDEYRASLKLATQTGADAERARIENNLANMCLRLGDTDEAERLARSSLALAARLGLRQIEAYNRILLGDMRREKGEMVAAKGEYSRALRILSAIDSTREEAQCLLRLASLYLDMGESKRAGETAEAAIEYARKVGYKPFEAQARLILGRLHLKSGDAEKALKETTEASALDTDNKSGMRWEIEAARGSALLALGKTDEAKTKLEEARAIAVKEREALPSRYRDDYLAGPAWRSLENELRALSASTPSSSSSDERWERLLEINRRLNLEHDLTRLLELIMDSVLTLIKAERGFIILDKDGKLDVPVARNIDRESIAKARDKISRSIAEEVLRSGKPLITVDAQQDERLDRFASVRGLKLRSILSIPLRVKDKIVGALYVDNRFQRGAFGDDDRKAMEAFGEQAAIAIENARLIQENETRRLKLEASHKKIQALVEELERKVNLQKREIVTLQRDLERAADNPFKYDYAKIVGRSKAMRTVFSLMDKVTDSSVPALIEGESGTGKELVARALHFNGPRKNARFMSENCSAIPETLLESELFGHEKGAFTGASEKKIGVFEAADGGTIFLDEIGDMSLNMQAKLLRALQEGEIRRVGGEGSFKVDVRVVSATHMRLEDLIREGKFREDLYWRLNVVKISIPPLRERIEDIPDLVAHFTSALSRELSRVVTITPDAMRLLIAYDWPGNVRELENEIKRTALMSDGAPIEPEFLSARIRGGISTRDKRSTGLTNDEAELSAGASLPASVEEFERRLILKTLAECGGSRVKAAKKLGIARRTLYDKLERYGLGGDE